jgi:hypothetical protein
VSFTQLFPGFPDNYRGRLHYKSKDSRYGQKRPQFCAGLLAGAFHDFLPSFLVERMWRRKALKTFNESWVERSQI